MTSTHLRMAGSIAALGAGLLSLGAATAPATAIAAPAAVASATVTVSPTAGMVYTGTTASTITRVSLSGATFTVDDTAAISAGAGCSAVAGDPTQARCPAPKEPNGAFKRFTVKALSGNDTVFNFTTIGMIADGGTGNDSLNGSVTAGDNLTGYSDSDKLVGNGGNDSLSGGSGPDLLDGGFGHDDFFGGSGDDIMRGGDGDDDFFAGFLGGGTDGADLIDGGTGLRDRVDYTNYSAPVTINLLPFDDGAKKDGAANEGDNILSNVENVDGSLSVANILFGNDTANKLLGGSANDIIFGAKGADLLVGNSGDDIISSNSLPLLPEDDPLADGAKDTVIGGLNTDSCLVAPEDGDKAFECEK